MLMQSIARILVKYGGNALVCGVGGDAALALWDLFNKSNPGPAQKLDEIQQLVGQSSTEALQHAVEVVAQEAAGLPETERQRLTAYLSQVPNAIRASQRRPKDPSGRTVSSALRLQRPEDLLVLLPARGPRFKVGDRPMGVGDWELEELLGMGGFGEVWKAKNPYMAQVVALKFCLDPAAAKMLKHEATVLGQVMAQGRLPGIVQLRNTYLAAEVPCLEYEFVSGGDLTSLAHRLLHQNNNRLPVGLVTNLMRSMIRGVRHAHHLTPPIVHRDLKPANILVQRRPDGKVELRIADFGIGAVSARCELDGAGPEEASALSLMTGVLGSCTPLYCSPQQERGEPPDPRDDVHALGVIWYQLLVGDLTNRAPAEWSEELADRQVPDAIIRLIGNCLSTKAERRPADAGVLAEAIEKLASPPVLPGDAPKIAAPPVIELPVSHETATDLTTASGVLAEAVNVPVRKQDKICVSGVSASAQRGPRELDLMLDGDEIQFHVHNPGGTQRKVWAACKTLQESLDRWKNAGKEGPITVAARTARKEAELVFVVEDDGEIEVQADWWIWAPRQDVKAALEELGIRVPWR